MSAAADQAHLRSHSGPGASEVARQPSHSGASVVGRHRAACPRSGRFRTRAVVPERILARVCREAGAAVRRNVKLRDIHHSACERCPRSRFRPQDCHAPRSPTGSGHYPAKRRQCLRGGMCECSRCERCRVAQSTEGQGDQVRRVVKGIVASWSFRLRPADVGVTKPSGSSTLWVQFVLVMPLPGCSGPRSWLGGGGGPACWPFLVPGHLPVRSSNAEAMEGVDGPHLTLQICLVRIGCLVCNFDFVVRLTVFNFPHKKSDVREGASVDAT